MSVVSLDARLPLVGRLLSPLGVRPCPSWPPPSPCYHPRFPLIRFGRAGCLGRRCAPCSGGDGACSLGLGLRFAGDADGPRRRNPSSMASGQGSGDSVWGHSPGRSGSGPLVSSGPLPPCLLGNAGVDGRSLDSSAVAFAPGTSTLLLEGIVIPGYSLLDEDNLRKGHSTIPRARRD